MPRLPCLAFALAVGMAVSAADPKADPKKDVGRKAAVGEFTWADPSGKKRIKGRLSGTPSDVQFHPDGTQLAIAGFEDRLTVWDAKTGAPGPRVYLNGPGKRVAFSPDGRYLSGIDGKAGVEFTDLTPQPVLGARNGTISGGAGRWAATADGRWVVAAGPTGGLNVTSVFPDPPGGRTPRVTLGGRATAGHAGGVTAAAVSPNGRALATSSEDKSVIVWNVGTGAALTRIPSPDGVVTSVAFHPDGKRIAAAGSPDNAVYQFDAGSGKKVATFIGHRQPVHTVAYSPDGKLAASAGADPAIKIWETATGKEVASLEGHKGVVKKVVFSPDGTRLASAGEDCVILWTRGGGVPAAK